MIYRSIFQSFLIYHFPLKYFLRNVIPRFSIIRFSYPSHFADNAGLLNIQGTILFINKTLNKDYEELSFELNSTKIAFNVAKTEAIVFKTSNKN